MYRVDIVQAVRRWSSADCVRRGYTVPAGRRLERRSSDCRPSDSVNCDRHCETPTASEHHHPQLTSGYLTNTTTMSALKAIMRYINLHLHYVYTTTTMKKALRETQTLRAGCSKAEPKISAPPQIPSPGARDGQNLISWRWSLPSPANPVW